MTEPDGPLSDRLRARAETFEPQGPALDDIRRKGTRRRWGRRAGIGLGSVVILAGVLAPLGLLSRLDDAPVLGDHPVSTVGSSPWQETYDLSRFELGEAPPSHPGDDQDAPGLGAVGVRFDYDWSGDIYPGDAQCRIEVLAADGTIVGSADVRVGSLLPHTHTISPMRVAVDGGDASTATGSCGPGTRPTGDYRFSDVRIEGTTVRVTVTWGSDSPPGAAWCAATSTLADGSTTTHWFTLQVGNPREVADWRVPEQTVDFGLSCEPYTTQADAVAASDARIESEVRPINDQISAILGAHQDASSTEEAHSLEVIALMDQRAAICDAELVLPELEHSDYVSDVCQTTLQRLSTRRP